MAMLVDRERELEELNQLLAEPAARMLAVIGRRRLGKTTLLVHWARSSGLPFLYWVGSHFPSDVLLAEFSRMVWQHANGGRRVPNTFSYESWPDALEALAEACQGDQKHIIVLDEFPYAVTSEPGLPSALQNAWDHSLRFSNICLVLCGSHVGMMERLLGYDAPLYGRMVGPLRVRPLSFQATASFFPDYDSEQRVAAYAVLGGVPAYLERFSQEQTLMENLRRNLFRETGLFRSDPDYLVGEQVRDLGNYQSILAAIAGGARQPAEIAEKANLPHRSGADPYLVHLVEMDYVRRDLPVTVPPKKRASSRLSRYVLADNYLRFYFRFVRPNLSLLAQGLHNELEKRIAEQLQSFIGMTAFEELCQEWVLAQANEGKLPFAVEQVGSHWGAGAQVDVVAINWREKRLLLGEAKWRAEPVGSSVIQELVRKKTPKVLKALPDNGDGWTVDFLFFSKMGFNDGALEKAKNHGVRLVDLTDMVRDIDN
jgi:AAA+ ATPase superfamily predicted ATPase